MKKIALIYSGYDKGLNSLEHNREGVAKKLKDFGAWEIKINKALENEEQFTKDIDTYKNEEIDDLLIYYTGHGRLFGKSFQLQLSENIGISLDIIYEHIKQNFENAALLPKRIAIVIDACYSGKAVTETIQFGTSEILASSLDGLQSFEKGFPPNVKSNMSLFSHYFCDAIETLQQELESINLFNIQYHLNKNIKIQTSPRSLVDEYGYKPMVIAKGNVKEQNLADTQRICIYFDFDVENDSYLITLNSDLLTKEAISSKALENEAIHQKIIKKIKTLTDNEKIEKPRIEVFLPKEAYGIIFPLWNNELDEYQVHIRSYQKFDLDESRIKSNQLRWNRSYEELAHKNMSYGNVTLKIKNKAKRDNDRISLIVTEKVDKESRIYADIELSYFIALWIKEEICQEEYSKLIEDLSLSKLCNVANDIDRKIVDADGSCIEKLSFMWDNPNILPIRENNYE